MDETFLWRKNFCGKKTKALQEDTWREWVVCIKDREEKRRAGDRYMD